jgi:ABC-type transporter Mla subunit MlaD
MKMFSKIGKLLLCGVAVAMIGCTDYDKDIQSVAGDVAQNATEIKNLDNAIKALEAKLAADYATKQELNAVKTALEGTIDTEVAALQAAIADAVKDLANAEDVAAVEASVKALQAAAADAAAAIEATDVKVGAIDERLTAVETAIEAIDEVAEQVLADVESLKNGYMETVAFAQQAQANIDALTEQTVDLEGQVAALEAVVNEMAGAFEERINTLGQTIGNLSNLLTDEVAALQLADEEIYAKIEMVEGAVTAVNNLIGDLQTADEEIYVELNKALAYIGNVAALIEDEAAARANEDEQIYIQLNTVNETISTVIFTVADLETRVAEVEEALEAQVAAYEAYVAATDAKLNELRNTFESLSPVIARLEAQSAELKATLESLAPEFNNVKAQVKELQQTLVSLGEQLPEQIAALQGQTKELLSMLNSLSPIIKQLQAAMGELRSIVFVPEVMYDGVPAVEFKSVSYSYTVVDPKTKEETVETVYIALPAFAYYHFNPSSFDIEKGYYSLIDRAIEEKTTKAGVSNIATVMGVEYAANGTVAVELLREGLGAEVAANVKTPNFFALEAVIAETGAIIRSDYAKVIDINEELDHQIVAADTKKPVYGTVEAAKNGEASFHLIYNKTLDLNAAVKMVSKNLDLAKYGFKVNVALVDKYVVQNVDQQKSVKMENGVLSTNPANSKEAIGRTPLVKFTLVDANDVVIEEAYAKVQVVVERPADFKYVAPVANLNWADGKRGEANVTWEMIREYVYKVMDISQDEFYYTYIVKDAYKAEVKDAAGKAVVAIDVPVVTPNTHDESSYNISWNFWYNQLPKYKGTQTFTAVVTFTNLQASSERPTHVVIEMPVAVTKAPKYEVKAEGTYETSRLAFEVKDILSTLWALYKLPNTKETLAAAAEAIQSGDLATAIKLLGGVPGIVKEKATFTAVIDPKDLSKYEDNIADMLKPILGDKFSGIAALLGSALGEKIFEYLNEEQTTALLTAMAQKEIQIKVAAANAEIMAGVAGGNWGKLLEGLDALAQLPLVEQSHVDMLKVALLGIAAYPVPADEDVTVKITKTEVAY